MATCDDGQASYKEPWRCTTSLNKLIDTMPMVSHGRLVGLTQRLARTQMWFATANPTAGAPPSAQAIYADAWNEACTYVISDKKLLAGSALNDGLRKLKQAVDDLEGESRFIKTTRQAQHTKRSTLEARRSDSSIHPKSLSE